MKNHHFTVRGLIRMTLVLLGLYFTLHLTGRATPYILYDFTTADGPTFTPPGVSATAVRPFGLTRAIDPKWNAEGNPSFNTQGHTRKVDLNAYSTFTIAPSAGEKLNLSWFEVKMSIGKADERQDEISVQIRSSLDAFALPVATVTMENSGGTGILRMILPLSDAFLGLQQPVEIRIYVYRINDNSTVVRMDDLTLTGENVPLPVEISSFTAKRVKEKVEVQWRTVMEQDVSHFILEKSNDGIYFWPMATVKARGPSTYTYSDVAKPATYYYRVKTVDRDETTAYTRIVAVEGGEALERKIFIRQGDREGWVNFSLNERDQVHSIRVTNVAGQELYFSSEYGPITIPGTDSVLIVSVVTNRGVFTKKLKAGK